MDGHQIDQCVLFMPPPDQLFQVTFYHVIQKQVHIYRTRWYRLTIFGRRPVTVRLTSPGRSLHIKWCTIFFFFPSQLTHSHIQINRGKEGDRSMNVHAPFPVARMFQLPLCWKLFSVFIIWIPSPRLCSLYSIFYLFSLISWLLSISPLFLSVCDVIEDRETHGRLFPFVYSSCVSAAWQPR